MHWFLVGSSSLGLEDEAHAGQNPLAWISLLRFQLKPSREDEGAASGCGHINWALVVTELFVLSFQDGRHQGYWQLGREFLRNHVHKVALFSTTAHLPGSTLHREAVHECAFVRLGFNFFSILDVRNRRHKHHLIESEHVLASSDLHNSRQERHRVEQARNPE